MSPTSLYATVMGRQAFERLDQPVRRFHALAGQHQLEGRVAVLAPASWPAKLLAFCLGAPLRAAEGPIRFQLSAAPTLESWTRVFPNQTMRSTLTTDGQFIIERLGASRLRFTLLECNGSLEMRLEALHFLGLPCPAWLRPTVVAVESGAAGQFHFRVQASVPFIGLVASYRGHLNIPHQEAS
jgi:hypothetical protein